MTTLARQVGYLMLLLLPGLVAAADRWAWGVARIGSAGIEGGVAWSYDLPPIRLPSGESISLQATLRAPTTPGRRVGTEVEWHIPQVSSYLAPRSGGRWIWRAPNGADWAFDPPFASDGALLRTSADGFGCVTCDDGWRFFYDQGALHRIMSPTGVMLRVTARGAKICRIETGPVSRPVVLLTVQYSPRSNRVVSLETLAARYSFITSPTGEPLAMIDDSGTELVRVSYTSGVVASIAARGGEPLPVRWRKLGFWESGLKSSLRCEYVLCEFGGEKYDLSTTQSDLTIRMEDTAKTATMIYSYYSQRVQFGESP